VLQKHDTCDFSKITELNWPSLPMKSQRERTITHGLSVASKKAGPSVGLGEAGKSVAGQTRFHLAA
jgi:hypothetical protein